MKHIQSAQVASDLARAEQAIDRRRHAGLMFGSVRVALGWYYVMRERLSNPKAATLVTTTNPDTGEEVLREASMGARPNLDEVHATLLDINEAINRLQRDESELAELIDEAHRLGRSQDRIAQDRHVHQSTISRRISVAEEKLVGWLRDAAVVR